VVLFKKNKGYLLKDCAVVDAEESKGCWMRCLSTRSSRGSAAGKNVRVQVTLGDLRLYKSSKQWS
jgi:hypothetical protein